MLTQTPGLFRKAIFREEIFNGDIDYCLGVNSAEGLQKQLEERNKLLLCFDEFKLFVSKCSIQSSVLLPCVNTLFEEELASESELVLTDNYAPAEDLLNPITATPFEYKSGLVPRSTLNPLWIAGSWLISLTALYYISTRLKPFLEFR